MRFLRTPHKIESRKNTEFWLPVIIMSTVILNDTKGSIHSTVPSIQGLPYDTAAMPVKRIDAQWFFGHDTHLFIHHRPSFQKVLY